MNRLLFLFAVFLAGGVVMLELRPSTIVSMPPAARLDDRPADAVPGSWARFAQLVQDQFKALLEANNATANRFRLFLASRAADRDLPSRTLLVQVWVGADGKVQRVEFPALSDQQADADLRMMLKQGNIGRPPPDMPQPLRVKLAIDPRI